MPGSCPGPPFKNSNLDPSWAMALMWRTLGWCRLQSLAWKVGPKLQALLSPQLPEGNPLVWPGRSHGAGGDGFDQLFGARFGTRPRQSLTTGPVWAEWARGNPHNGFVLAASEGNLPMPHAFCLWSYVGFREPMYSSARQQTSAGWPRSGHLSQGWLL